jgi:hypothetical protein
MVSLLMLCAQGCGKTYVNDFCIWAEPITITETELASLTDLTLRELDHYNEEYRIKCLD